MKRKIGLFSILIQTQVPKKFEFFSQNVNYNGLNNAQSISTYAANLRNAGIPVLSIGIKVPINGVYVALYNLNELDEISCGCSPCNRVWEVNGLDALIAESNYLGLATCDALLQPIQCTR